jgi:hypothetical protein
MPKFISNFKNKLIEHEGFYNTQLTVKPVIEHANGAGFAAMKSLLQHSDDGTLVSLASDENIIFDIEEQIPKDPSTPEYAQYLFNQLLNNIKLSRELYGILSQSANTIVKQSTEDKSFITLVRLTDLIYGNSYFSIKVYLINYETDTVSIASKIESTLNHEYYTETDNVIIDKPKKDTEIREVKYLNSINIDKFGKKNIIWQQDKNKEIDSQNSTYTFKAPDNPSDGKNKIITTIRCAYNGAAAEIIIGVQPNKPPPDIDSDRLNSIINSKFEDIKTTSMDNVTASDTALNMLASITLNQSKSVVIPAPSFLKSIITDNSKYPNLKGSTDNIYLSTTTNIGGIETLDLSSLPSTMDSYNLVIASLIPNSTINIQHDGTNYTISRNQLNQISFNGTNYMSIPASITINNKKFTLVGLGSPAIFRVTESMSQPGSTYQQPETQGNYKPSNIWEYLFYFAYPVSFIGAMFYSMISLVSTEPISILLNKNWVIIFNIYVGICSYMSIYVWFNKQNPILNESKFNQKTLAKQL